MAEANIWTDLFQAMRRVEDVKIDMDMAYSWRDQQIAITYKNGVPVAEIARRIHLSEPTIHKILKQQGAKE